MLELVLPTDWVASPVALSPSQHRAAEGVMRGLERGDCAVLQDRGSDGKTTVLGYVHQQLGGVFLSQRNRLHRGNQKNSFRFLVFFASLWLSPSTLHSE